MERIFISGFSSRVFLDIFNSKEFTKKYKIIGWCISKNLIDKLRVKNKSIEIFDIHSAIRGFEPAKKNKTSQLIEYNCDKIFLKNYNKLINLFSRSDPSNIYKLYNREAYIKQIINSWYYYIYEKKIRTVLLTYTPHLIHDFIIYEIAKFLKLKIIILESTKYLKTYFFINRIEQLPYFEKIEINKNYRNLKDKLFIEKFLHERKKVSKFKISDIKNYHKRENVKYKLGIFYYVYLLIKTLLLTKKKLFLKDSLIWTYNKENYLNKNNLVNEKDNIFFSIKNNFNNKYLEKKYLKLCGNINLNIKYIYYAGSLLPEKSVIPDGLNNYNDIQNLKMIRKVFGDKILIYYKIHPLTFLGNNISHNFIDEISFKTIAEIKNIKLVNHNYSQKDLVKNSYFNSTISGDVGLESVLNNKPCILFGNTWYGNCKGIFLIKNINDLLIFKKKIKTLKIDIKKFKKKISNKIYKNTFSLEYNNFFPLYENDKLLLIKNINDYNNYIVKIRKIFKKI